LTPLKCGIIFGGIPAGAISRKGGLIWGIPDYPSDPEWVFSCYRRRLGSIPFVGHCGLGD
jgi:hypothetical protein